MCGPSINPERALMREGHVWPSVQNQRQQAHTQGDPSGVIRLGRKSESATNKTLFCYFVIYEKHLDWILSWVNWAKY